MMVNYSYDLAKYKGEILLMYCILIFQNKFSVIISRVYDMQQIAISCELIKTVVMFLDVYIDWCT